MAAQGQALGPGPRSSFAAAEAPDVSSSSTTSMWPSARSSGVEPWQERLFHPWIGTFSHVNVTLDGFEGLDEYWYRFDTGAKAWRFWGSASQAHIPQNQASARMVHFKVKGSTAQDKLKTGKLEEDFLKSRPQTRMYF